MTEEQLNAPWEAPEWSLSAIWMEAIMADHKKRKRRSKMLRYYMASKLRMAPQWIVLANRAYKEGGLMCSRWPYIIGHVPESDSNGFWSNDFSDIDDSDCVIVYAEGDDQLRGALVEVGYALAKGIPVYVIGEHECYGTWIGHPLVTTIPLKENIDKHRPSYVEDSILAALERHSLNAIGFTRMGEAS
jgi:hypothetical protein